MFEKIISEYPETEFKPKSMFALNFIYYQLQDTLQAKILKQDLIKQFPDTIDYLEDILFRGSTHLKRGIGITILSYEQIMIGRGVEMRRRCSICHEFGHNKNYCLKTSKTKRQKYFSI